MTYNGWPNYETWSVVLLINNDPTWQQFAHTVAKDAYSEWYAPSTLEGFYDANPDQAKIGATRDAGDAIKNWIEAEALSPVVDNLDTNARLLAMQLIQAALSEVDWYRIAEATLADD